MLRASSLRRLALPICVACLIGSVVFASLTSQPVEVLLAEGQKATDYFAVPGRAGSQAKTVYADLEVRDIRALYIGDIRTRLASSVWYRGRERTVSSMRPLWTGGAGIITLAEAEYAPRLVVRSPSGRTLYDQSAPLELSTPESEDFLDVPAAKIRVVITLFPDHEVVDGKDSSRSLNAKNPRLRLTVFEKVSGVPQQRVLVRKTVSVGEVVSIPDGTTVAVTELKRAGRFRARTGAAVPIVAAFALLTLVALADAVVRWRTRA